jgi:DNA polymerase IIIc chi subunit
VGAVGGKKEVERDGKAPKVVLHRLAGTKKALDACRLIERLYTAGKRVAVYLSDGGRAKMFDEYLWTFAQHSFVPHVLWGGEGEVEDPVVVVTGVLANPNRADLLVIGDKMPAPGELPEWKEVHDFVTAAPEDKGRPELWAEAGFVVEEARGPSRRGMR